MKLPWIRSPTSVVLGTATPTPNPSMASPRRMLLDALIRSRCPSVQLGTAGAVDQTRTWALLPSMAADELVTDVIRQGRTERDSANGGSLDDDAGTHSSESGCWWRSGWGCLRRHRLPER